MQKTHAFRSIHTPFRASVIRSLTFVLAGGICLSDASSLLAAGGESLVVAAIRAFDRNQDRQLSPSEHRTLRIRLRPVFDGDGVSSEVIRRVPSEVQAIYAAADLDRSVSLSSSESRAAAAILSSLSPTSNRRSSRLSRSRTSSTAGASVRQPGSSSSSPAQHAATMSSRGSVGSSGTARAPVFSRGSHGSAAQNAFLAAQLEFERMRARMQREADLRSRGIEIPDSLQSRAADRDGPSSDVDTDDRRPNSGPLASRGSHDDGDHSGSDDQDDDNDDRRRGSANGRSGSGAGSTGTSGSTGRRNDSDDSDHRTSEHHEEHDEGHGEGHHEGRHEEHDDHDDDD